MSLFWLLIIVAIVVVAYCIYAYKHKTPQDAKAAAIGQEIEQAASNVSADATKVVGAIKTDAQQAVNTAETDAKDVEKKV